MRDNSPMIIWLFFLALLMGLIIGRLIGENVTTNEMCNKFSSVSPYSTYYEYEECMLNIPGTDVSLDDYYQNYIEEERAK